MFAQLFVCVATLLLGLACAMEEAEEDLRWAWPVSVATHGLRTGLGSLTEEQARTLLHESMDSLGLTWAHLDSP